MKWKLSSIVLLLFLLLPTTVGAVDFSIPDVQIYAHLQADGTVEVNEQFTYDFDSEFNGIIREMQPKKGALIEEFTAYEKNQELKVEKNNYEYRAHRKGRNEKVTFDLNYTIVDGMEKYEDGVQFYWPFFDRRNETDYDNMTITIVPPSATSDVLFLGYDSAEGSGNVEKDGRVVFAMGTVYSGENGDIRVVYEPSLFPAMNAREGEIRPVILAEQQRLIEEREQFIADQQKASTVGAVSMVAGFLGFAAVMLLASLRRKRYAKEAQYQIDSNGFYVPAYDMSMPATILFKNGTVSIELLSAALLDLVRKGHVKQTTEEEFELVDANVKLEHEKQLIQLLFYQIGEDHKFTLKQLMSYTKAEKNYEAFTTKFDLWKGLLKEELKQYDVKEDSSKVRLILSGIAVIGAGVAIYLLLHELYGTMVVAIILAIIAAVSAIGFSAYNYAGMLMKKEWEQVDEWMKAMDTEKWEDLTMDDRFRVLIYGVGTKHPELDAYYKSFAQAQTQLNENQSTTHTRHYDDGYYGGMVYNPVFLAGSFSQASTNISTNAPASDSSSSGGGGGTGGGGGGSGAF
ncbi:DUF2207 domain-containing protein [Sporosarcina sp. PTS2304]|uniref:DUF2207 domain-containing protein n=1 Tax=Sporosarcina sp. PTS2304 TaxID=2283194 RepID=UPI000E0D5F43|nr:DUF2207 domain-containing protein [Sporosarcina sp. PTS2304]AXI00878.1 DUF2207 domain-containing protein [Sporosarcina sp. PTS2304]